MNDLDARETRILLFLRDLWGIRVKAKIRHAWETGDYSGLGSLRENDIETLQHLRNCRGPGWLSGLSWSAIAESRA